MSDKIAGMCLAAGIGLFSLGTAWADGYVVGHVTVMVGPDDVRDIYLGEMQFVGKTKLIAVHNGAVQGEFLYKVIKMDPDRYAEVWAKKSFREGVAAPTVKIGDAEVLEFVKYTPGAIGYVSTDPGSANVIMKY